MDLIWSISCSVLIFRRCQSIRRLYWTYGHPYSNYNTHLAAGFSQSGFGIHDFWQISKTFDRKIMIIAYISLYMCFECSKEPSHQDGSFEHPQHMILNTSPLAEILDSKYWYRGSVHVCLYMYVHIFYYKYCLIYFYVWYRECSGPVIECFTRDWGVAGSSLTVACRHCIVSLGNRSGRVIDSGIEGLRVQASQEALCFVLLQDTLSST